MNEFLGGINFSTVMDILKLVGVAIGILAIIKQRAEVIIAKSKQKSAEVKATALEDTIKKIENQYEFIGDTLLSVVHASKMSTEDKTKATEQFLKVKGEIKEVVEDVKEAADEIVPQVVELVEGIKGVTSGIIKRD